MITTLDAAMATAAVALDSLADTLSSARLHLQQAYVSLNTCPNMAMPSSFLSLALLSSKLLPFIMLLDCI
jgi:hypothetical protein